jgi:hypothetical protein
MKKIYSIFCVVVLLAVSLNAQTLRVTFEGDDVSQGDTLKVEKVAGEEIATYFNLTNLTESPMQVRAAFSKLNTHEGDEFLMCFGDCTLDTISPSVTLEPNVEFTNFDIAYTPASDNSSMIRVYLLSAEDNSVIYDFYVKYYNSEVSLPTQSKVKPMNAEVYPNPMAVNAVVNYYVPAKYKNPTMIIRNMVGKTVKTYNLRSGEDAKLNINSSELTNGVYFYSIVSEGQTITTKKLVIRK